MPLMKHPEFPDRPAVETSKTAFEAIWKDKGWYLFTGETISVPPPQFKVSEEATLPAVEALTYSQLRDKAEQLGIEGHWDLDENALRVLIEDTPEFYGLEASEEE